MQRTVTLFFVKDSNFKLREKNFKKMFFVDFRLNGKVPKNFYASRINLKQAINISFKWICLIGRRESHDRFITLSSPPQKSHHPPDEISNFKLSYMHIIKISFKWICLIVHEGKIMKDSLFYLFPPPPSPKKSYHPLMKCLPLYFLI